MLNGIVARSAGWMPHSPFTHSPVQGHLSSLIFFKLMSKAARLQTSVCVNTFFFLLRNSLEWDRWITWSVYVSLGRKLSSHSLEWSYHLASLSSPEFQLLCTLAST